jgi:hypothetical protein
VTNTNYIVCIVKILESPIKKSFNKNIFAIQFRAQLPNTRNNRIINLAFWGNLVRDVEEYYKVNDYVIIEGYVSVCSKKVIHSTVQNSKMVKVTVSKIYPFLLSSDRSIN